jgi:glycosyltransferase involved in cell wall biosynthesis
MKTRRRQLAIFVATSGHSGVDRVIDNLVGEFTARGIAVDLLRIANHGPYFEAPSPGMRFVELGSSHVNTSLPPLVRYLKRERPQALLTDKDRVNRLALWARRLAGVPTRVVVRIGTTVSKNLERRSPWARWSQYHSMRWFYPWADAIVVPSRGAAQDLANIAGIPLDRIRVVPNPIVTPKLFNLAEQTVMGDGLMQGNEPVILGVGELCARKDFTTLIKAFSKVRQSRPCRLLILGEGRQRNRLEALITQLGLENDVEMPGFVKNPYAYMAKADLLVLSSHCEGFGNVIAEALAIALPVVSTDCPSGPREILQDGRFGTLVPVGDANALARAILTTLDKPMDAELLKSAAKPFSVAASASQYLAVLGFSG